MGKREKRPWESVFSGLAFGAGFGIYWFLNPGQFWPIFPIVFAGVLPFLNGLRQVIASRGPRLSAAQREALDEKQILRIARDSRGVVTPALVALESELTTSEAEAALERMARKGFAAMRVTDDGRVQYEFPDLLPRLGA
jgi:hypothetical protein